LGNNDKNLNLIQVLRGAASLLVVLYHTSANVSNNFNTEFFGSIFFFGSSGVDIFFVLSGFIITYTSYKNLGSPGKLGQFLVRRVVRIFPVYWIIISFFLLTQIIFPAFYRTHFDLSFANIAASYFLLPGHVMINGVSWSLSYELFFYFLFALAFLIPRKRWAFALFMIYAFVIIILYATGYELQGTDNWVHLVLSPMNVEFFLGVLAAVSVPKLSEKVSVPFILVGIILFLLGSTFIDLQKTELHPDLYLRVVLFGPASFFIITGIVKFELNNKINVHNLFLKLGEASYSLYLIHLPVMVAFVKIIAGFHIQNILILHGTMLLVTAFICYTSILFYKFVEKPMISKLNSYIKNRVKPGTVSKLPV
jgi:exopolysaccharide production protein ExoZ